MPPRRPRLSALLVVAALPACRADPSARPSRDSGQAPSIYFLVPDGGGFQCPDAATAVAPPDAALCVPSRTVSYASDVLPIFTGHCNGENCHNSTWGSSAAFEHLVNVPSTECCKRRLLVEPGAPDRSYVIRKLRGVGTCGGRQMPLGRHLADTDVQTLWDWICEGAPRH